ncbi:hypothetical protein [Streptomyces sp. NPDC048272]|uniref:hypothetical protein n=1 Tax=Streptomyces sp. NPDC048272 TaxID=3154616 RepID=UPI0034405D02
MAIRYSARMAAPDLPYGSGGTRVGAWPSAGLEDAEDVDLTDPDFVEWRGAGPEAWDPSH